MTAVEKFNAGVGALAFLAAVAIVGYISIIRDGATADTALGALIALVSAGAGWYFRGRLQNPEQGQVTIQAAAPATASVRTAAPVADEPGRTHQAG